MFRAIFSTLQEAAASMTLGELGKSGRTIVVIAVSTLRVRLMLASPLANL